MSSFPRADSLNTNRERPRCRRAILARGLRPYLVDGQWDGRRALCPDGTHSHLSQGMRQQMQKMIGEGHWSEAATPTGSSQV